MAGSTSTPSAKFNDIPGSIPDGQVPKDANYSLIAEKAILLLNHLSKDNLAGNVIWRDILSFTDTFRTFYSPEIVFTTLDTLGQTRKRSSFSLGSTEPRLEQSGNSSWLDIDVIFDTQDGDLIGKCAGTVSVVPDSAGQWKIWMLRTWLENFDGHGHPDQLDPVNGEGRTIAGAGDEGNAEHIYDAIIVGGGQSGLGTAGRFKALGVDYILFDERQSIGDTWKTRYESLKWHTIKEYSNLPLGRTFSEEDDDLLTKDRIGEGYKAWAERYGINARPGSQVDHASWDASLQTWTVRVKSTDKVWKSKYLILSTGPGVSSPVSPEWASPEKIKASGFKGTILHGAHYTSSKAWAGKRGIVIGTANTAHDVAEDMADAGMHTTMIQRSPTFIFPGDWLVGLQKKDYNLSKPTAQSDREHITQPIKILREMTVRGAWGAIKAHPERFDALEKAGFRVDRYGDLFENLYIRAGGHYVDIGASARIAKGEIKVKGALVKGLTETGLMFEDGSRLDADVIVTCTGFNHNYRRDAARIVGEEIANQMDEFWGVDAEGELRGETKLAGHPNLFYHGGEARLARFYSRFLGLQLQKLKLGQPLVPYLEGRASNF